MALTHVAAGEPIGLHPMGMALRAARTSALFKSRDLEVIRLVLHAGKSLPPHAVPGEITIHCLEGRLRVDANSRAQDLAAGELLYLEGGVEHAVFAHEDCCALVTISLRAP
jgi:quercetin dioxygenase-like cupin family protein